MTRLLLLLVACASPIPAVRLAGAALLKCPAQHLAIERTGTYDYRAAGCGYSIALRCASPTGEGPCGAAPVARPSSPAFSSGPVRVVQAVVSEPLIALPPPPLLPYQPIRPPPPVAQAPHLYMPGQYNPNIGAIQHDYAHQYTRPYTPPPPVYTPHHY
jgi:hypothetical protein